MNMQAVKYAASAVVGAVLTVGAVWSQVPIAAKLAATWYCNMVPAAEQDKLRDAVNVAIEPHSIELTCGGEE